jgi:hypothetical protein
VSTTQISASGQTVATWIPAEIADRLRAHALIEERSVSQIVRRAVIAHLNHTGARQPSERRKVA